MITSPLAAEITNRAAFKIKPRPGTECAHSDDRRCLLFLFLHHSGESGIPNESDLTSDTSQQMLPGVEQVRVLLSQPTEKQAQDNETQANQRNKEKTQVP